MWQGKGQDAARRLSLSRNPSSTDSFEEFLSEFEVVQRDAGPAAASTAQPVTPASPNPFTALLSRSPFKNLQGRPPRPDPQISSQPYQPKPRSTRVPDATTQPGYQSQMLLPVTSSPPRSPDTFTGHQSYPGSTQPPTAAIMLTPTSPAVASATSYSSGQLPAQHVWLPEIDQQGRMPEPAPRGWLSEGSYGDAGPAGVRSEEETLRWGLPPREDLWPLGLQLPAHSQSAAPQPGDEGQPGQGACSGLEDPQLGLSRTASGHSRQHAAADLPVTRTQSDDSLQSERQPASVGSVIVHSVTLQGKTDEGLDIMDIQPKMSREAAEQPPSGYPTPFAAAAQRPVSPSSSSGSQYSPQGSLESESDYGSSDGPRRGHTSAHEHERLSEAELPSGSEAAGTQPGSVSDYGSQISEERAPGATTLLASIPERLIQLSTVSQGDLPAQPAGGLFKGGHQKLYMGGAASLLQPGHDPRGAVVGRSNLRKRDFESELLERLLSQGGYKGPIASPPARLVMDTRLIWRAIGLPKMAFITAVFLCLAFSLMLFTGGRLHAQRVMRSRAEVVGIISVAPQGTLESVTAGGNLIGMEHLTAGISGDARHHHSFSNGSSGRAAGHIERNVQQDQATDGDKDAGDARLHDRHTGSQEGEGADLHKRTIAGLRLLQAHAASIKLATSGLRLGSL